jgi:hypothetical protein
MKKIRYSIIVFLAFIFTSCYDGFLDQVPDDKLTLEETFSSRSSAEKFLANIYLYVPNEFGQRNVGGNENAGPWTGASDEAEYLWGFVQSNNMNIGNWDANSGFVQSFWSNYYKGIRSATYFLANIDNVDPSSLPDQLKKQYKAEARSLRAMYYFYLMRIFGPVVILEEKIINPDAPVSSMQFARNSFDECVEYVVNELDLASIDLPSTPSNDSNYGRITTGIAQAFKIKTLLFSASPLFNGNADYADLKNKDGKQLINQQYDANKWKVAADAHRSFISEFVPGVYDLFKKNDSNGNFDPYLSCRDVFLTDWNKEVIFARPGNSLGARQYEMTPYHKGYSREATGSGGLGATQEIVDDFFMQNGKGINDAGSGYVSSGFSTSNTKYTKTGTYNQWVNREPRFYVNITYHGSTWLNTNTGVITSEFHYIGNSGKGTGSGDYSPTGYVVRKAMGLGNWDVGGRTLILIRLAEIYLDYAEALNEAEPGHTDIIKYVNLIRERAGIPQYGSPGLPTPVTQAEVRELIRKERRIELAFENVRFFDVRRWKIAEQTDNKSMKGLNIDANAPEFFQVVPFETRVFAKRHYLFPIPQLDISADKLLVQNPGW